ncbi:MAG: HupE/UreJ family protein [Chloroflexi bacterium]|nr:HupE/UreJ family protein [Chloroflexota bacterium]
MSPLVPILAHTAPGSGAIAGFLHPILGLSHLIAMVTVGLLSAQLGGRAIWTVPATFLVMMAVGGVVGLLQVQLPFVDLAIAASIVVLGVLLLARAALPEWVAMLTVGIFGIFHGYAHGINLPQTTDLVVIIAYVTGFLVSTAGLHVVGALIGYIALRNPRGLNVMRVAGIAIAAAGVLFIGQL